jgi:[ribosomal protein S5]-alanine N-acetyltransferase
MTPLAAGALRLEPLRQPHAAALYPLLADPALYVYMDHGPPASEQALADVYTRLETRQSPDGTEQWLNWVVQAADGQALGFVQATVFGQQQAWVAYVLGRAHWGQGHARLSVAAMLAHLQGEHGVRQCLACVERANARSLRLLQNLGFEVADARTAQAHALTPTEVLLVLEWPATCHTGTPP